MVGETEGEWYAVNSLEIHLSGKCQVPLWIILVQPLDTVKLSLLFLRECCLFLWLSIYTPSTYNILRSGNLSIKIPRSMGIWIRFFPSCGISWLCLGMSLAILSLLVLYGTLLAWAQEHMIIWLDAPKILTTIYQSRAHTLPRSLFMLTHIEVYLKSAKPTNLSLLQCYSTWSQEIFIDLSAPHSFAHAVLWYLPSAFQALWYILQQPCQQLSLPLPIPQMHASRLIFSLWQRQVVLGAGARSQQEALWGVSSKTQSNATSYLWVRQQLVQRYCTRCPWSNLSRLCTWWFIETISTS